MGTPNPLSAAFLFAALLLFPFSPAAGTENLAKPASLHDSPLVQAFDQKALDKLSRMSAEEIEELDQKLAQALTLYYDREYARALPIFKEISQIVETVEIMFWYGSCARRTGDTETCIRKYQDILAIDPNLHSVRVELAAAYAELGRVAEAKKELNTVLQAKPSDAVKANAERVLASLERKKKLVAHARLSIGIQHDSNLNAAPEQDLFTIPGGGGTIGPLPRTQKALSDWVVVGSALGSALYDMGNPREWMWNAAGSYYQTRNPDYRQFDYTRWAVSTGPWWVGSRSVFKLPVGMASSRYRHDPRYDSGMVNPNYEFFFTPRFSVKGSFAYVRERYEDSSDPALDRSGEDNINRIWEINPNFYLNNRKDILSFYFSDENLNAENARWSYDAVNLAVSYLKPFQWLTWEMEFYARYLYTKRDYAAPVPLWPPDDPRTDKIHNVYVVLSRNFLKYYFASLTFNWIRSDSTVGYYDYDRIIYGFHMGVRF